MYAVLLFGIVALAYLAPWPVLVQAWTWAINDPNIYAFNVDTGEWAHRSLFLALFLVVAAICWRSDRWLAGIVALAGAQTFFLGPHIVSGYLLIGVGAILTARLMPEVWRDRTLMIVGVSGIVQALMICAQWWKGVAPVGTLGVSGLAGCYVAMTGLLLPKKYLALTSAAVLATGSRMAIIALVVGLAAKFAPDLPMAAQLVGVALIALGAIASWSLLWTPSTSARIAVKREALVEQAHSIPRLLVGSGFGSWYARRATAKGEEFYNEKRIYVSAHDDLFQWFYETGLVGVVLLTGWLVRWRSLFLSGRSAPALVVVAVMALAWFPFHDLRTGFLAALLVGVGSPTEGA